jgi:hypothetical protein
MARKWRYNIEVPTWGCPHCHFIHHAADLVRLNFTEVQCRLRTRIPSGARR